MSGNQDNLGINLHAQKDFTQSVVGSSSQTINQDWQQALVQGDQVTTVALDTQIAIGSTQTYQVGSSKLIIDETGVTLEALQVIFATAGGSVKPLARLGDFHHCPKTNSNNQSHVGGKVVKGSATVLADGKPVARIGDPAVCKNGPMDHIAQGNHTLLVNGEPAAHLGFSTAHGGKIQQGSPTAHGGIHASAGSASVQAPKPIKPNWHTRVMAFDEEKKV